MTLAPQSQGRGLASEAFTAVMKTLSQDYGFHRVYAQADERNLAVHRLFEHLGFCCEAVWSKHWFKGEWSSLRVYAHLRRECRGIAEAGDWP